jgi:hypothetical protein
MKKTIYHTVQLPNSLNHPDPIYAKGQSIAQQTVKDHFDSS